MSVRVQLGNIPSGDYGLRVVSADGSTVIIDGTSDMFRIAATGTLSVAMPAVDGSSSATVTVTALGSSYTTPPAYIASTTLDTGSLTMFRAVDHAMGVNSVSGAVVYIASTTVYVVSGQVVVALNCLSPETALGTTGGCRYYILQQVAI